MPTSTQPHGALHVEPVMGTVFTLAIRDPGSWDDAFAEVTAWLHGVDRMFSTYRADSDISRIRAGELSAAAADPLVRSVLGRCAAYEDETDRYFTANLPGGLDPSGLVKGWAIERASQLLRELGSHNHAVNGGGDIQFAGEAAPGRPWRVGINDPYAKGRLLTSVTGRDFAIATSGSSERGAHIVNPHTGKAAAGLASVTVVGPSIERADVYATAAVAMGSASSTWLEGLADHDALVVHADGTAIPTSRFALHGGSAGASRG
jgi:thiamine biosynthesis lipoprotein